MEEDTILVKLSEYESLTKDAAKLAALEELGVDNWEGYGDAMRLMRERENEDAEPVGP